MTQNILIETSARGLSRHNHLADRPEREPGKFQMRPGEGNADDRYGEQDRSDQMSECKPPTGEN